MTESEEDAPPEKTLLWDDELLPNSEAMHRIHAKMLAARVRQTQRAQSTRPHNRSREQERRQKQQERLAAKRQKKLAQQQQDPIETPEEEAP